MMNSETKRLCGRYLAENKDDFLKPITSSWT